jgi:4-hydroxy-tetrahydrodipicolinate reductase
MHHNKKVDAPSGTAFMLAEAVKSVLPEKFFLYGREGKVGARTKDEIGIHALRGGNVVGEHEVIFAGENEVIKLSHSASDRSVFADGAVRAAIFMKGKKPGMYNMDDLIG